MEVLFCLFVKSEFSGLPLIPARTQSPETTSAAPVTDRTEGGKQWLERDLPASRWPRRCDSVPCAATTHLGTTTVCGLVRAARPSLRGASRVGNTSAPHQSVLVRTCIKEVLNSNSPGGYEYFFIYYSYFLYSCTSVYCI